MVLAATLRKYSLTFLERKGESWQSSSYDLAAFLLFYKSNRLPFHASHTKIDLEIVLGRAVEPVMALAATLRK
jgi:hypothetical protein